MHTTPQETEVAVVRLLLMDKHRKQVVLCKHPAGRYWLLPGGLLPDDQTPLDYLISLARETFPEVAQAELSPQLEACQPAAWLYPPAEVLPNTDVLQAVYLLTLSPDLLQGKGKRYQRHGEVCRFFSVEQLPDDLCPLDEVILQTVCCAEARQALPIDGREAGPEPTIYELDGVSFRDGEPVLVVGGGKEAESVQDYRGCTGKVVNLTNTWPRWLLLVMDDGRRIGALPHHLQRLSPPPAIATILSTTASDEADLRQAARAIQSAISENWHGRAGNVYGKRDLSATDGIRIIRARVRQGSL